MATRPQSTNLKFKNTANVLTVKDASKIRMVKPLKTETKDVVAVAVVVVAVVAVALIMKEPLVLKVNKELNAEKVKVRATGNTTLLPPLVTKNQEKQEEMDEDLKDLALRKLTQGLPKLVKKLTARTAKRQTKSQNSKSFLAKTHKNPEVVEASKEEMKSRDHTLIRMAIRDPPDNEVAKIQETITKETAIKP